MTEEHIEQIKTLNKCLNSIAHSLDLLVNKIENTIDVIQDIYGLEISHIGRDDVIRLKNKTIKEIFKKSK